MWRRALFKKSVLCLLIWGATGLPIALADPVSPIPLVLPVFEDRTGACRDLLAGINEQAWQRLQAFYQPHGFNLVWNDAQRLETLLKQLEQLADDGLDTAQYHPEQLRQQKATDEAQLVCADVFTSHTYLTALQHLALGRLDQTRVEPIWYAEGAAKDPAETLLSIAEAGLADPAKAFERARPSLDLYVNLRRVYAKLRHTASSAGKYIPEGPSLRPGMEDERVPLIEQRLRSAGYLKAKVEKGSLVYSEAMAEALSAFQRQNSLQADGVLGDGTRLALNVGSSTRLEQLRINLERLRWIAHEMEPNMLLVDVAGARLIYYRDRRPVWWTRTQVGQPERATPLLKSTITRLTLNPTWTVPPTILREDKLPRIRQSPDYLRQHGLQVLDQQGQTLDPNTVNWSNPQGIRLRQEAGTRNPLGRVAVRFANPFSVYLHDTPSKHLFDKAPRAFSSGCVRVEGALKLVEVLINEDERETVTRLLDSGKTHQYRLSNPLPILMAYWTAEADLKGQPLYRPDIYQKDPALLAALRAQRP